MADEQLDAVSRLLVRVLEQPASRRDELISRVTSQYPEHAGELRERIVALESAGLLDEASEPASVDRAAPSSFPLPRRFDGFVLESRLGGGGMGVVFRAQDASLTRDVALKLIRPELALFDDLRERFQREARAVARLDHPNIVPVFAVGEAEGIPYLAMPFVAGCSLADLIDTLAARDRRPTRARDLVDAMADVDPGVDRAAVAAPASDGASWSAVVARLLLPVVEALEHAHARGVVHRDVKPSNIMVARDGRPLLVDFGLAADEAATRITRPGAYLGSLPYSSPEQVQGAAVDHRSDVFSIGVVMYELCALRLPFDARSTRAAIRSILSHDPPDLHRVDPAIHRDLAAVVAKCMEKDAARRYRSAAELAGDLRAFLEHRPVGALRLTPWLRLRRFARREPLRAAFFALLCASTLSVAGLGGYLFANREPIRVGLQAIEADALERELTGGYLALARSDRSRARAAFERALERAPGLPEAHAGLSILGLRPAPDRGPITESSTPVECFVAASALLFAGPRGDRSAARRAAELMQTAVLRADRARALYHFTLAKAAANADDDALARDAAAALRRLWPTSPLAHYGAGYALLSVDHERAAADLRSAVRLDPRYAPAHADLGIVELALGRRAAALRHLRRATELDPDNARAHVNLGVLLLETGDHPGATAASRRAIALDPQLPGAHYNLGRAISATDPRGAIAAYRRALELEPRYAEAWNNLGGLHYASEDFAAAREAYARLVELWPARPESHRNLGAARAATGDAAGAAAAYRRVVDLDPDDLDSHEYLCVLLEHVGDVEDLGAERARLAARRAASRAGSRSGPSSAEGAPHSADPKAGPTAGKPR